MAPNNANNKKASSKSTRNNSNVVNKVVKNVKNMDMTSILLVVIIVLVIYLVFFDDKMPPRLYKHNHHKQENNEGFNNNSLGESGKCVLVLFHAKWCGYCKKFMPTWEKAKSSLQSDDVVLKEFEADEDSDVMTENNVKSYPTLKLIKKDGGVVEYEGERSMESLESFLTEHC